LLIRITFGKPGPVCFLFSHGYLARFFVEGLLLTLLPGLVVPVVVFASGPYFGLSVYI
jgi:hypothetical protein